MVWSWLRAWICQDILGLLMRCLTWKAKFLWNSLGNLQKLYYATVCSFDKIPIREVHYIFYLLHFIFGIFQIFHQIVFLQPTFLTISILGNKHLSSLYKSALFATVTWHEVCREMSNKDEVIIVLQVPHDSLYSTPLYNSSNIRNQTIEKDWRSFYFYLSIDIYRIDPCWL